MTHTHTHTHTAAHFLPVTLYCLSGAPLLSVSVVRQRDSPLWLGVCSCRGEADGTNLTWVLPENAKGQTSLHSEYEGRSLNARLTYQFPLDLHEGQDLTCVYQFKHGVTEERTVHIPRYREFKSTLNFNPNVETHINASKNWGWTDSPADISSVRVLNHTTPLQSRYGGEPVIHRVALQENDHNQKILLRVEGNVPQYDLSCKRWCIIMVIMGKHLYTQWTALNLMFPYIKGSDTDRVMNDQLNWIVCTTLKL